MQSLTSVYWQFHIISLAQLFFSYAFIYDNIFLTLSFIYGKDSYFDKTSVMRQTYKNYKKEMLRFVQAFLCLLLEKVIEKVECCPRLAVALVSSMCIVTKSQRVLKLKYLLFFCVIIFGKVLKSSEKKLFCLSLPFCTS
jgi:hypothetical protein